VDLIDHDQAGSACDDRHYLQAEPGICESFRGDEEQVDGVLGEVGGYLWSVGGVGAVYRGGADAEPGAERGASRRDRRTSA